nr:alpha-N-acetylgalactosaminide alpha-2,6-sialyltransferase 5-like isoform X2 [Pelodiscus sinensis]|eukprot:XP_025037797.1 alpha-N-acetylgalactosaminide alpha-2,6-sialyltransferase 5-like isoform X2 [Pelodiscus sinensis]
MKTLARHGLAVCLVLTTMCTSLLLMYGSIGGGGQKEPNQQQQVAAAASGKPESKQQGGSQQRPRLPVGAGLLEGYISVVDHKVHLLHSLVSEYLPVVQKAVCLHISYGHVLSSTAQELF